jgi:hypothetical protein
MHRADVRSESSTAALTASGGDHAASVDASDALPIGVTLVPPADQSHWAGVMCLMGLSYFSTLSYQPTIAFQAMGLLAPLATVVLVALTLFGALPVARRVAHKSPHGQGSIGLIERLLGGWSGKCLVLVVLGFAVTNLCISTTLSAADAAQHLIHNPLFASAPAILRNQMFLTMVLLVLLAGVFLRGFRVMIAAAVVLVGIYLALNVAVILSGLWHLATHPSLLAAWYENIATGRWYAAHDPNVGQGAIATLLICLLLFPQLALGLSGLEAGIFAMPLLRGDANDGLRKPEGRIRNTQKLLTTAALVMSFLLLGSSVVTSMLIQPEALQSGGAAANRALAFIAHGETAVRINPLFGALFGTVYDISTVATQWFAGAAAMAALLHWTPHYLAKYGVPAKAGGSIAWLVLVFTGVNLLVTWFVDARVEAQAGALSAAVLVLICNNCLAVTIVDWNRRRGPWYARFSWRYFCLTLLFLAMAVAIIVREPAGLFLTAGLILMAASFSIIARRSGALAMPAA